MELTTLDKLKGAEFLAVERARASLPGDADTLAVRAALIRCFLDGMRFAMDELCAESQGPKPEAED